MATAPVTLLYRATKTKIATLELDATPRQLHTTRVTMTDSPVEQGVDITDHLRKRPDGLKLEGIVTNHPFGGELFTETLHNLHGNFQFSSTSTWVPGRAETAYQQLLALAGNPSLFAIVTSLRTYTNMALEELEVPRDAQIGESVKFSAVFREVQIVQNQTVQIARTQPGRIPNKNVGKQPPQPVPKSVALRLGGKIEDVLKVKGGFFQ